MYTHPYKVKKCIKLQPLKCEMFLVFFTNVDPSNSSSSALLVLLCRGKALKDFTAPDCRFLSFKKSETIYVYYKLAGRRTDMWAGSVSTVINKFCTSPGLTYAVLLILNMFSSGLCF